MKLTPYLRGEGGTPDKMLVSVLGTQFSPYEPATVILRFTNVPIEEVTPEAIQEILLSPGIDAVEISIER